MKQMTPAEVERAMKLQDVMLRAMAERITWVSGGGDSGDQLPADVTLRVAVFWSNRFLIAPCPNIALENNS